MENLFLDLEHWIWVVEFWIRNVDTWFRVWENWSWAVDNWPWLIKSRHGNGIEDIHNHTRVVDTNNALLKIPGEQKFVSVSAGG